MHCNCFINHLRNSLVWQFCFLQFHLIKHRLPDYLNTTTFAFASGQVLEFLCFCVNLSDMVSAEINFVVVKTEDTEECPEYSTSQLSPAISHQIDEPLCKLEDPVVVDECSGTCFCMVIVHIA